MWYPGLDKWMVAMLEAECSELCEPNLFLTHLSQPPAVLTSSIGQSKCGEK